MANLPSVGITAGVPTSGTGTVSTIDNLIAVGLPISNGTSTAAIKAASTAPLTTDPALVVSISPNSVNANGQATSANSAPVALSSNQTFSGQNAALPTNQIVVGGQFNTTPTTITTTQVSPLQLDNAGNLLVNIKAGASSGAVAQGSTTSGQTGSLTQAAVTTSAPTYTTAQTSPLSLNTSGGLRVDGSGVTQPVSGTVSANPVPTTTGGLTVTSTLIASGTNATSVKASAGQIYKIEVTNNSANIGYLKIYNTASAPTAGSGTPVIRLMCPASASGAGSFSSNDLGVAMSSGIGFTFTGGIADADTTSVAASAFIVNIYYK